MEHVSDDSALDFDPLKEMSFDCDESTDHEDVAESVFEDGPFNLPNPNADSASFKGESVSFANGETAQERIAVLFDQMPTQQRMLLRILEMCESPLPSDELDSQVVQLKTHHHSVFDPLTFCDLLEQAGALVETDENGQSLSDLVQEPLLVEWEGEQYWQVAPAPNICWMRTEEGTARLESYRPLELIGECYDNEPQYADVFTTVLNLCAREGGASVSQVGDAVDDEPILQKPRRYAMYFIDKLERAGGLEWIGSWCATEAGLQYLDGLQER